MSANNQHDLLSQLRDIHYPDPVSWWPLAPGWWLLIIVSLIFLVVITYFAIRWQKNRRYRQYALQSLKEIKQQPLTKTRHLDALAQLIKRTLLAAPANRGRPWLQLSNNEYKAFLARNMPEATADLLVNLRYQPISEDKIDSDSIQKSVENWIKKHKP